MLLYLHVVNVRSLSRVDVDDIILFVTVEQTTGR